MRRLIVPILALSACTDRDHEPASVRDISGYYQGTGYAALTLHPVPIAMTVTIDGKFAGNVRGGPGAYPRRTGHWTFKGVDEGAGCVRVTLRYSDNGDTDDYCFAMLRNGRACMLVSENDDGLWEGACFMERRASQDEARLRVSAEPD